MEEKELFIEKLKPYILLAPPICLVGGFYDFIGAYLLIYYGILLLIMLKGSIKIRLSIGIMLLLLIEAGYIVSSFYALDKGMAYTGIIKYLWIIPAVLIVSLKINKETLSSCLPTIAALICCAGFVAYFIPYIREYFYINNRFAGTFAYPNTFAIFLLICIILLIDKKKLNLLSYAQYVIMLFGIGLSASRTVMVMTCFVLLWLFIRNKDKKLYIITAAFILAAVVFILAAGSNSEVARITHISLYESAFAGRLLYIKDAFFLLLKYPSGLGHMGYYYIQNSIQSGYYTVMYVHNDLMQLALDTGIVFAIFYVAGIILLIKSKQIRADIKAAIVVLFAHGMLDFDMAFSAMLFIMLIFADGAKISRFKRLDKLSLGKAVKGIFVPLSILGMIMAIPLSAYKAGNIDFTLKMLPHHTQAQLEALAIETDADAADKLADDIINHNKYCALAYYAKATVCDINQDYDKMIEYGYRAIELDYFNVEEYYNYIGMLYDGVVNGDYEAAEKCRKRLYQLPDIARKNLSKLGKLGKMIDDQPQLDEIIELK